MLPVLAAQKRQGGRMRVRVCRDAASSEIVCLCLAGARLVLRRCSGACKMQNELSSYATISQFFLARVLNYTAAKLQYQTGPSCPLIRDDTASAL